MMKKMVSITLVLLIAGIFVAQTVSASLTANNEMVYDNVSGLYWYQDLTDFTGMTYSQQTTAISNLTTGGFSWHLATEGEMDSLIDNVGEQILYGSQTYPEASQITDAFMYTQYSYGTYFYMGIYESSSTTGYHNIMEIQTRSDGSDDLYFVTGNNLSQWTSDDRYPNAYTGAWVVADANPVPVPATMTLLGIGLLGLAGVSRREK